MRPKPEPITAAPGQQYGEAAQQKASQQIAPMGAPPVGVPPSSSGGDAAGGTPDLAAMLQAHAAAGGGPHPDGLTRPSERPNEPVTHGLPVGPGGGPDMLTGVGAAARNGALDQATLGNLLDSMTTTPGTTTQIIDLAQRLASGNA